MNVGKAKNPVWKSQIVIPHHHICHHQSSFSDSQNIWWKLRQNWISSNKISSTCTPSPHLCHKENSKSPKKDKKLLKVATYRLKLFCNLWLPLSVLVNYGYYCTYVHTIYGMYFYCWALKIQCWGSGSNFCLYPTFQCVQCTSECWSGSSF